MQESRVKNSIKNSTVGIACQLLLSVFAFVSRTVFIKTLGVEYLGVGGLYSNILTMLSLSDLGIYTVMVYSLYKPIAEHDEEKIAALISYFQRLYWAIAVIVLIIGVGCIPFLRVLVKDSQLANDELIKYYVLYLLNSLCTYIAVSRTTLLRADQKAYIIQIVTTSTTIGMYIYQIVLLYATRKFTLYLVIQICFTLANNLILTVITERKYPFLKKKIRIQGDTEIRSQLIGNFKGTFLYKIGNMVMNSTDNMLISILLGTAIVGYYSNYVTVFSLVNKFIMIIINAILASIGNYVATKKAYEKFDLFRLLLFVFYFLASFCCGCYLGGMEDFIRIWIGKEYIISGGFLFALVFNRFVYCAIHPLWMMRESSGIFISTRYVMIVAAVSNIVLSIVGGMIWGLAGIIAATAIAYLVTVFWYEPIQLCRVVFCNEVIEYWKATLKLVLTSLPCLAIGFALRLWRTESIIMLFIKFGVQLLATVGIYFTAYKNQSEYEWVLKILNRVPVIHKICK